MQMRPEVLALHTGIGGEHRSVVRFQLRGTVYEASDNGPALFSQVVCLYGLLASLSNNHPQAGCLDMTYDDVLRKALSHLNRARVPSLARYLLFARRLRALESPLLCQGARVFSVYLVHAPWCQSPRPAPM